MTGPYFRTKLAPRLRVFIPLVLVVLAGCADSIAVSDSISLSDDAPRSTDFDTDPEDRSEQRRIFDLEPDAPEVESQSNPDPSEQKSPLEDVTIAVPRGQ